MSCRDSIFPPDSPFRRLPQRMPRKQVLFHDGLRLSAEMADQAYTQLIELLRDFCQSDQASERVGAVTVLALTHAYAVIDAIHRFRRLLNHTPGLKHSTDYKLFQRQTASVEALRNIVQHLYEKLDDVAEQGFSALGTITFIEGSERGEPICHVLQPGSFYQGQTTVGPMVKTERIYSGSYAAGEVTAVKISTSGTVVDLGAMIEALRRYVKAMNAGLEAAIASMPERMGSDTHMKIAIEVDRTGASDS